jgi:hypothetical protein
MVVVAAMEEAGHLVASRLDVGAGCVKPRRWKLVRGERLR